MLISHDDCCIPCQYHRHHLTVILKCGWSMEFSDDELKAINARRYHRNEYFDKILATEVSDNTKKPPLTESLYIIQFWEDLLLNRQSYDYADRRLH